jgi:MFS family permease
MKEVAMAEQKDSSQSVKKFAGIEIPPDLTKGNFFFLFLNTLIVGMMMTIPAIVQPAFLKDVININQDFAGSINGLLQNMSQIATLALVAVVGVLSDKVGRKILALFGFLVLAVFFYLLSQANGIAAALHIPAGLAAQICALASFVPSKAAEFAEFAPGLLTTYGIRLIIGVGLILGYPQFITMVADYTYEKDRGKGMAMNGVMMGLASILVFAIFAPILSKSGVIILIYIVVVFSLGGALTTALFLKDRMPETKAEKPGFMDIIPVVRESLPLKTTYWCSLITRADIVLLATFLVTWGVKYGEVLGMEAQTATMKASIPMMVMGFISLVCFPVMGVMLDKWGRVPTIILALFSAAVSMFLLAVAPNPFSPVVYVAMLFASVGMAGAIAGANTLAADASPKAMVGSILGGLNTMQPIGVLFFLGIGGYLFDAYGPGWAFGLKGLATLILAVWMFTAKGRITDALKETTSLDKLPFTMEWEDEAKKMLEKVPGAFREAAVTGTEEYARNHNYEKITADVMAEFRKELGM